MADKSMILSAEAEAALLKPIDEYVGKIQKQIDALRVDGSDKVRSLKNHIAIAKEDKNLTKEERAKIIAKDKADLEKAKSVESANKDKVSKLISDAESYLSKHYKSDYYEKQRRQQRMPLMTRLWQPLRQSTSRLWQSFLILRKSRMRSMYIVTVCSMHR